MVSSVDGFTAFDVDEFVGAPNDFIATLTDGANGPSVGESVTYTYVFTPTVGAPVTTGPTPAPGVTDANGKIAIPAPAAAAEGSYSLTVKSATATSPAFTFLAGESEIELADGVSASSPVNGVDNYPGTLFLTNPARTPLPGRTVHFTYGGVGTNATLTQAAAVTSSTGAFSAQLTDPAAPTTPETGTLTATATALKGPGDVAAANASDALTVKFEPTPVVTSIVVTRDNVFAGPAAPGKGVELNVVVRGQAVPDATPANDPILEDYPVSFAVNNGFLTPDTKGAGLNVAPTDLKLKAGESDQGDLFGFYEDLGADETVDTTDNVATDAAGVVATIGKDAGFNDDGLVTQTVTVTAGAKSATETVNYDVRNYLNLPAVAFRRDGGSTNVPGSVDLKFYAADQFGNLVGDQAASISDDSAIARVVTETPATTDFIPSNPAATASSSQPTTQKVTGTVQAKKNLVGTNGNPAPETTAPVSGDITLVWKKGGPTAIVARLTGRDNGGAADRLTVRAPAKAAGAVVKLFKIVGGQAVPAGTKTLGSNGRVSFTKKDKNGNRYTKYFAKVRPTSDTKGDRTNNLRLR